MGYGSQGGLCFSMIIVVMNTMIIFTMIIILMITITMITMKTWTKARVLSC